MFKGTLIKTWLNAAATSVGFYTGMSFWHEMPARQADFIREAMLNARETARADFAETLKVAAD